MRTKALAVSVAGAAIGLSLLSGCSFLGNPAGGRFMSEDRYTYMSTPNMPQTVLLRNLWTGEVIWTVEVPVGQQLVMRFNEPSRRAEAQGWDTMHWSLMPLGADTNNLENTMVVPPASGRRVEGALRKGPELASAAWSGGYGAGGYVPPPPPEPKSEAMPKNEPKPEAVVPAKAVEPSKPMEPVAKPAEPEPVKPATEPPVQLPQ